MVRAIDADRLAEGLKLHRQPTDQKHETDRQWAVGYNAGLERALHSITYAPTLTPQNEPEYREYTCPNCHHTWLEDREATDYPEYCPGCGDPLHKEENEPLTCKGDENGEQ